MLTYSPPTPICAFPGGDEGLGRVVRFHSECVLIPATRQDKQRPRVVTKSYSLPLWKKPASKSTSACPSPVASSPAVEAAVESLETSIEDTHFVFKVALPRIKAPKPAKRIPSAEQSIKPLSPCLVSRDPCAPRPTIQTRRPSLPILSQSAPSCSSVLSTLSAGYPTVPLRSCCTACHPVIEKSLEDEWQIKFSDGALRQRRIRSASENDSSPRGGNPSKPCMDVIVDEVEQIRRLSSDAGPSSPCSVTKRLAPLVTARANVPRIRMEDENEDELFPLPCARLRTPSPKFTPNSSPCDSTANLISASSSSVCPPSLAALPDVLDNAPSLRRHHLTVSMEISSSCCLSTSSEASQQSDSEMSSAPPTSPSSIASVPIFSLAAPMPTKVSRRSILTSSPPPLRQAVSVPNLKKSTAV